MKKLEHPRGVLDLFVPGEPKPKGSMRAMVCGGKAIVLHPRNTKAWQEAVRFQVCAQGAIYVDEGPLSVSLEFVLPRPKGAPKRMPRRRELAAKRPDLDKLVRAILDALKGVVYRDDSQVVDLSASKRVAFDERPGVHVRLERGK